ncbi:MAG: acetate/propionate family kinase [Erysipelotrichaceae bacterium]
MSKILVVNTGSSSLKFKLYNHANQAEILEGSIDRIGLADSNFSYTYDVHKIKEVLTIKDHEQAILTLLQTLVQEKIVQDLQEIKCVGHRVAHGGELFKTSAIMNETTLPILKTISDLAPLHNPVNVMGIEIFQKELPSAQNVAVFDTSFHQTLSKKAFLYPLPIAWYDDYKVRKYGFHGTSHKYVSTRLAEIQGTKQGKTIVCHLGNGASLCAIQDGVSMETSMGFTPLDGIMMGTRCGSIDPAIMNFISEKLNLNDKEVMDIFNKESGLLGVSGISSDFRDVLAAANQDNAQAQLALDIYVYRICLTIGSYFAALKGLDNLIFTAGIGENSSIIREKICSELEFMGILLDKNQNLCRDKELLLSTEESRVKIYKIATNEELVIMQESLALVKGE